MLRKLSIILLCVGALLSTSSFAVKRAFAPGLTIDWDLYPNVAEEMWNLWFTSIKATCIVESEDENTTLQAELLNGRVVVNGILLGSGTTTMVVQPKSKLAIEASAGAGVSLTNQGTHPIKAICSA